MTDPSADLETLRGENQRLRERVQRLRNRAGAGELGYVFVVSYGRSGSTLVLGLLNAIPGYLLRGENGDALRHLFDFHRTLVTESDRNAKTSKRATTNPWFGMADVPLDRSLEGIRALALSTILRPRADTRVTGFKEIRWSRPDLDDYVDWLREVFPGARFVVNTRDHAHVLESAWWAKADREEKAAHLADVEGRFLALLEHLGEAAYHVHYDDYVADPTALRGLYDWLGEPFDEAAVRATMAVRHSV